MAGRALPDLTSRLLIDTGDLPRAATEAKAFSSGMSSELGASTTAAQGFEGQLGKLNTGTVALAGSQREATTAASGIKNELAAAGTQAEVAAASSGKLSTATTALAASTTAQKEAAVATAGATTGLAVAQGEAVASTAASNSVMGESATVLQGLANVDGALIAQKKTVTKATQDEGAAHGVTTEEIKRAAAATGEFGSAGVAAAERLGGLGAILGPAGGVSIGLAGAVIGLGATVAVAKMGIDTFDHLGESVLKYQRITGASAEQSSRMIDVFGQLGVDGDKASGAMFMLNKRIEGLDGAATKVSKTLADVGVEVAKSKDGSVDLQQTLFNVADAYNQSDSAAQRDLIATTAFGKQAQALIPVLIQGSDGLRTMAGQAQLIFTQQQLDQVHAYSVEMARAGQEIDAFKATIGGKLVPALGDALKGFNEQREAEAYADTQLKAHNQTRNDVGAMLKYTEEGKKLAEQSRRNAEATGRETDALKAHEAALRMTAQATKDLYDEDLKGINASIAKQRADMRVAESLKTLGDETLKDSEYANKHRASLDAIEVAQNNYNQAVKAHGPVSEQARLAQDKLNTATDAGRNLDHQYGDAAVNMQRDLLDASEAMFKAAEATANLSGATAGSSRYTDVLRQALLDEQATLAPGSPLIASLQAYIDTLKNVPRDITTNLHIASTASDQLLLDKELQAGGGHQFGGRMSAGQRGVVGEAGPEIWVPDVSGEIVPNDRAFGGAGADRMAAGHSDQGASIIVNVAGTNADPWQIGRELAWAWKTR